MSGMVAIMFENIQVEMELLIRILVSGICGGIIGYERRNRLKEAGIRTHFIVALASSLLTVVSMYSFRDSRVAAQIVSGIGFLGAGLIFVKKHSISGLTTSAGIWATSALGMAIGSGLYFIGISTTLTIVLAQVLLYHKNLGWLKLPVSEELIIRVCKSYEGIEFIEDTFNRENIEIISMKIEKQEGNCLEIEAVVKLPSKYNLASLMKVFQDNEYIKSIEI